MNQITPYNCNGSQFNNLNWNTVILSPQRTGYNHPDPSHPAFIVGRFVIRPAVDATYNICLQAFRYMQTGFSAVDSLLSRMVNIIPGAAAKETNAEECLLPQGSYLNSCKETEIKRYVSLDSNVPSNSCVLKTKCETCLPQYIQSKENTLYFNSNSKLTLRNNNGTLAVLNEIKEETPLSELSRVVCKPLPGSHAQTCEINVTPYKSTDQNLDKTQFCQMKTRCYNIDGSRVEGNTIYYGHEHLRGNEVVVENCDGKAVIHETKNTDGSCAKKSPEAIRNIANSQGSSHQVLKNTYKKDL